MSELFNNSSIEFRPLTFEKIGIALALCEKCVGQNLYKKEELELAIIDPDRFFFLAFSKEELVGYIYFRLTDVESIASAVRFDKTRILPLCGENAVIGRIQSVGVDERFRGCGIASLMIEFASSQFVSRNVDICFVVCWKINDRIPLKNSMETSRFTFFDFAYNIWYDIEDLFCEYCDGRCRCDAALYYKFLNKER